MVNFKLYLRMVIFFDIGLSNGFRNKFAEAKATGNSMLAKNM